MPAARGLEKSAKSDYVSTSEAIWDDSIFASEWSMFRQAARLGAV